MACIKCGKDTASGAEFCEECLAEMRHYPVKPGTPVILPKREERTAAKHLRKKALKPEAQVVNLKKTVRLLWCLNVFLLMLLVVAAATIWLMWDPAAITSLLP